MNYAAFCSYGNDSIALLQFLAERGETGVYTVFSDTGWAADWWMDRVDKAEDLARSYGFTPVRIPSIGFVPLVRLKQGFPRNGLQFCTGELKIKPAMAWLDAVDPELELTCCVGIRREEGRGRVDAKRTQWPDWIEESANHGGRSLWSPLVRVEEEERNRLCERAGFEVLSHRSMECYPCINANRKDLLLVDDARVSEIERFEQEMGFTGKGKPRVMFRPYRHQGAVGIREVKRWAESPRGGFRPQGGMVDSLDEADLPGAGCDSGFCGL